ncbi:MAG: hypothetical protein RR557_08680 [Bacilli bacterium]
MKTRDDFLAKFMEKLGYIDNIKNFDHIRTENKKEYERFQRIQLTGFASAAKEIGWIDDDEYLDLRIMAMDKNYKETLASLEENQR